VLIDHVDPPPFAGFMALQRRVVTVARYVTDSLQRCALKGLAQFPSVIATRCRCRYVKECEQAAANARIMVAQAARVAYENTLRYSE
jgi:hypothetical protein